MCLTLVDGCFLRFVPRCQPALVRWRFLCVCAFGGFLLSFPVAYACLTIASLWNNNDAVHGLVASTLHRIRQLLSVSAFVVLATPERYNEVCTRVCFSSFKDSIM